MEVLLSSVGLIFFDVQPRNPGGVFWSSFGVLFVLFGGALVPCGVTLVPNWCQIGCYGPAKMVGLLSSVGVEVSVEKKENTTDKE
jgi:hypothetical protein